MRQRCPGWRWQAGAHRPPCSRARIPTFSHTIGPTSRARENRAQMAERRNIVLKRATGPTEGTDEEQTVRDRGPGPVDLDRQRKRPPSGGVGLGKRNEPTGLLVPELELDGARTISERESRHASEHRVGVVGSLKVVVWNTRVEMVDVVKADVAGKELQQPRQFQIRAAAHGGVGITPRLTLVTDMFTLICDVSRRSAIWPRSSAIRSRSSAARSRSSAACSRSSAVHELGNDPSPNLSGRSSRGPR